MASRPPFQNLIARLLTLLALAAVLGYGLFEGRRLIEGPEISITMPRDGSAVAGPAITIAGTAKNVAFFSINGKQAFVDGSGNFKETVAPPPGYTVITVSGTDRFGRKQTKTARITIDNFCPATG